MNQLWKLKNVSTQFKRASVILCINFCPAWALTELNSNPQSLPTRSSKSHSCTQNPSCLYLECCLSSLQILTLQVHSTNYIVSNFQLKAPVSSIMYIPQVLPFLPSLQSPPNRSDKQASSFNMKYAAFQVIQKVPFPKPFYDDSMIHFSSIKVPSRVSPILESNISFCFHCPGRPASSRTRGYEQLTERKH